MLSEATTLPDALGYTVYHKIIDAQSVVHI